MSGDEVAARIGWSGSKVSRIETHRTGIKASDLDLLLDVYDVEDERRDQLRVLADEQDTRGWWNLYTSTLAPGYTAYIGLEAGAASVSFWSPELIPGLLQTEDYAKEVTQIPFGDPPSVAPGDIQRRVDARLRRQELLDQPDGKQFAFVLDEATLRRRYGTAATMRAQLTHVEQLSRRPNVTVQVLAFAGSHPAGPGGFTLLEFASVHGVDLPDVVYIEHLRGGSFVEEESDVHDYRLAFMRLMQEALDDEASRKLIRGVARDVWT
jgi:hypothetical protein